MFLRNSDKSHFTMLLTGPKQICENNCICNGDLKMRHFGLAAATRNVMEDRILHVEKIREKHTNRCFATIEAQALLVLSKIHSLYKKRRSKTDY